LGTFGEITLDKKISRYCPFKIPLFIGKTLSKHDETPSTFRKGQGQHM
jgi:hypothetical protein